MQLLLEEVLQGLQGQVQLRVGRRAILQNTDRMRARACPASNQHPTLPFQGAPRLAQPQLGGSSLHPHLY